MRAPLAAVLIRPLITDVDHGLMLALLRDVCGVGLATLQLRVQAARREGWLGIGLFESAGGRLLGAAGYRIETRLCHASQLRIDAIVVPEMWRNEDLAYQLLAHLDWLARGRGCGWLVAEVEDEREATLAFWRRGGFTVEGRFCSKHVVARGVAWSIRRASVPQM